MSCTDLVSAAGCQVLIVRHGESPQRDDEVDGSTWRRDHRDRWFDPPLTERGLEHALQVAAQVQKQLVADGAELGFDVIAVSPLLRAVQTAQAFSQVLKLPIKIVPGLSACAAAVEEEGLAYRGTDLVMAKSGLRFRRPEEFRELAPLATWFDGGTVDTMGFEESVVQLCVDACAQRKPRILIVSHREGIRDLAHQNRLSTPYCCVGVFRFTREPASIEFQDCVDLVKFHRTVMPSRGQQELKKQQADAFASIAKQDARRQM